MEYIIKEKKLQLQYVPGKGAWTYHLKIPKTKDIRGKWGDIKVSGFIDDYQLQSANLAPQKGDDKLLSINGNIRSALSKSGGDFVTVTLSLMSRQDKVTETKVLDSFKDSDVFKIFSQLARAEQNEIMKKILVQGTEEKQIDKIVFYIRKLSIQAIPR